MEFIKRIEVGNKIELEEIKEKLKQLDMVVMANDKTLTLTIYSKGE